VDFTPPFDDGLGMVRFIRGTLRLKKDIMIACEGGEGTGKSTTAGNIAKAVNPGFNMRRDIIKDIDHLLEVMLDAKKGQLYVLDEAVNLFHNQDWATWEAKTLSKLLRQMRVMESVWICNIPDFEGLHPYVRNNRIQMRLYHRPVYEADGMTNGPSQVLWKQRYWSNKEQREVTRWSQIIEEFHVPTLDALPEWQGYELDKVTNFKALVSDMQARRKQEANKERKAAKLEVAAV
jgi:hypothetical protein